MKICLIIPVFDAQVFFNFSWNLNVQLLWGGQLPWYLVCMLTTVIQGYLPKELLAMACRLIRSQASAELTNTDIHIDSLWITKHIYRRRHKEATVRLLEDTHNGHHTMKYLPVSQTNNTHLTCSFNSCWAELVSGNIKLYLYFHHFSMLKTLVVENNYLPIVCTIRTMVADNQADWYEPDTICHGFDLGALLLT